MIRIYARGGRNGGDFPNHTLGSLSTRTSIKQSVNTVLKVHELVYKSPNTK